MICEFRSRGGFPGDSPRIDDREISMRRFMVRGGLAALAALFALTGCEGGGTPSVSGSNTEVTVKGKVTYKGQPVTEGEIRFDPANINRRDAKIVSAPIGKDGTYTVKTLQGENTVRFNLPTLAKQDFGVASASITYDAPGGESTKDFELAPAAP